MTYADIREYDKAIPYLRRCLQRSDPADSHVRKTYALLVLCHQEAGQLREAWDACQEGLAKAGDDRELQFRKGSLLHALGRLPEAAQAYLDLLGAPRRRYFQSVVEGIDGYMARHNLALVYEDMGRLAEAEQQWRQVVGEKPAYKLGWKGLCNVLCRQDRCQEALTLAEEIRRKPGMRSLAAILKSQALVQLKRKDEARRELQLAIAEYPRDVELAEALCHLLFENQNPAEAEKALEQLIHLCPDHAAGYHNLGTVRLSRGKVQGAIEAYQKSLVLRPAASGTWVQLGHSLLAAGRRDEAVTAWHRALRHDPANPDAHRALAQFEA
jgi:tetratricopeptide (TPR) repeat protein